MLHLNQKAAIGSSADNSYCNSLTLTVRRLRIRKGEISLPVLSPFSHSKTLKQDSEASGGGLRCHVCDLQTILW